MERTFTVIVLCVMAGALVAQGCSREAPRDLRQARRSYEAGAGLINQRLYARAVEEFDRAIELDPGYAEAYCDRGIARYMMGEPGPALRDFEAAIEKDPTLGKAHFHRAVLLDQDGRTREAIEAYQSFIRHSERSPEVYVTRANKRIAELKGNAPPLSR